MSLFSFSKPPDPHYRLSRRASVHHLTHNVICLYQANNTGINFICWCFLQSKNSLGRSTRPQLLPRGVIHTLMNDLKDVYEEMSVHLPRDVTDGLEQSIILPRSAVGLSTATPSRIVSRQGGHLFFFFSLLQYLRKSQFRS